MVKGCKRRDSSLTTLLDQSAGEGRYPVVCNYEVGRALRTHSLKNS